MIRNQKNTSADVGNEKDPGSLFAMRKYLSLEFGIPSCDHKKHHKNKTGIYFLRFLRDINSSFSRMSKVETYSQMLVRSETPERCSHTLSVF